MKRLDKRRRVWITQPIPHGNDGWCGDKNLSEKSILVPNPIPISLFTIGIVATNNGMSYEKL